MTQASSPVVLLDGSPLRIEKICAIAHGQAKASLSPAPAGLKAWQISVSAGTAEALQQTMPACVLSWSTECHRQDNVRMGAMAARDALVAEDRAGDQDLQRLLVEIHNQTWSLYAN